MSASESIFKFGTGARNLAIAAGIVAAIGVAWWLVKKSGQVAQAVGEGAGFLTGTSNESSLGSWLYDVTHPEKPAYWDASQAEKTRIALIAAREKTYGVD